MKRSDTIQAATDRDPAPKQPPKVALNVQYTKPAETASRPAPQYNGAVPAANPNPSLSRDPAGLDPINSRGDSIKVKRNSLKLVDGVDCIDEDTGEVIDCGDAEDIDEDRKLCIGCI
jgi:hypothetical protein